ncbi:hypothetical protein [Serratia plymuthica]|uniref:hypothetical protein n=1 Tax=Serratia plymuthica TaxID=82996 RepID=UPI0007E9F975|nr:hypothetical protein [Serratia plymuthica]ANJ93396.1 hypothetical protein ADP72_10570 [Serratia plymuthica]
MQPIDYLNLIKGKNISFRVVQHALKLYNLPSARGWDPLLEHYRDIHDRDVGESLKKIYLSQLHYGERTIFFSQINESTERNITAVADTIKAIYRSSQHRDLAIYRDSFPLPLSQDALNVAFLNNPCPAEIDENEYQIKLFFTYPRVYKERTTIDVEDMDLNSPEMFPLLGFEEIIGVRSGRAQSFDCIVLNKITGGIQFHIDHSKNILKDDMEKAAIRYRHLLMDKYQEINSELIPLNKVNIYQKIDELYNSNDGRIFNLEHATSTGSVKTEKMRKRVDDLRDERFHTAGLDAISGETNNFAITKQWDGGFGSNLKLTIDGSISMVSNSNPFIDYATIEGCVSEDDFNLLISKVL